jgi:uncharacterized protein (TIGR04255 family)
LAEALCEFHFDPGSPWDVTLFGHFYDRIRDEFPKKREVPEVEMSVQQQPGGVAGQIREAGVRMQFIHAGGDAMVQLAPRRLVVNKLPPYESWPVFKSLILARLADYEQAVGSASPLQRVGLRYINRFNFPAQSFTVGSAFAPSEFLPVRLREAQAAFFVRLEMPQEINERILLTMGTLDAEQAGTVSVLLDLEYVVAQPAAIEPSVLSDALEKAHDRIEQVFESCLTDPLRNRFNQEV